MSPCHDGDQYLVSMIAKSYTFGKQQGLYHNKVNLSLTSVQRLGRQAVKCKMEYWQFGYESLEQNDCGYKMIGYHLLRLVK